MYSKGRKGFNTSGISTMPLLSFQLFSRIAIMILGTANAVPFTVCTSFLSFAVSKYEMFSLLL